MSKDDETSEPLSAPEVNPEHIDLDIDTTNTDTPIEPTQTIEEAEKAAEGSGSDEDDAIYKEASEEVNTTEPAPEETKTKKSKKKLLVVLFVLLLLAGGATAAWYFFLREKPTDSTSTTTTTTTETEASALTYVPETISYAFRDSEDVPYTLFWRPAIGGDRTQVQKLNKSEVPDIADTYGANVAFHANGKIYVSTDFGKTYTSIYEVEAGAQITDIKFSSDGTGIAIGYLSSGSEKSVVKSIGLDGKDSKDLFTANSAGVIIMGWNNGKIAYTESCFNCDGATFTPYVRNLSDNKVTALLEGIDLETVTQTAVSGDLSQFIYVQGVKETEGEGFIGYVTKAPYKIKVIDIAKSETTEVATVGKAGETNQNGTAKYRDMQVGFLAGSTIAYYIDGSTMYSVVGGEANEFYKSEGSILFVTFASENSLVLGIGSEYTDYALTHVLPKTNEVTVIFQGDTNTNIFGVTTK